jgi:signal transduction histidine kinase
MRWRIRSQLLVPLLILLLGVVGISTWTAFASAQHARHRIETQMRDIAQTANQVAMPHDPRILKWLHGLSEAEFLRQEPDGGFSSSLNLEVPRELLPDLLDDWQEVRLGPRVRIDGRTYLCSGVRVKEGGALYILYPESLWHDALWAAVRPPLILGAFGGVASLVLAIGVAQRLSRRVRELERRTRLIAAGDFSPMPLPSGNDEIRDLTQSVNEMAQRLAQLQETVRQTERLRLLGQISGGLAHQLRNGVTGAKLAVQLHADECAGKIDTEALDVALRQLALVDANLKRFLEAGRTDLRTREPCSLAALIEEAVALLQPQCRHARIELTWKASKRDGTLTGDAGQLGQLFLNVIGNAIEAAGPGGRVSVSLNATPKAACIEVRDSGPGPAAEIAERLFEPFVTGKREGVGLGLAVARQAAEAHGGHIAWRREEGQTCFVIELPLESGVRNQESGVRGQESGDANPPCLPTAGT